MNMMRKNNNNRGGNRNNRGGSGGGGQRRYNNNGGGNRSGQNDGQNLQRQKHHATQQLGKYNDMARNAQVNGDRVDVEYYLQHVDHYNRILSDIAAIEAERHAHQRESQIIPGGPNDPNAQSQSGEGSSSDQSSDDNDGNAQQPADAASGDNEDRAARPLRQPRRQLPAPDTNGAREANSNVDDIPLPGSILPPI